MGEGAFEGVREFVELNQTRVRTIRMLMDPASSYYPELPRKSKIRILWDLAVWLFRNKEINDYYNLYGLDIAAPEREMDQYQAYRSFMRERARGNLNGSADSQIVLLRDKYLFFRYMDSFHLPVPRVFALRIGGNLLDADLLPLEEASLEGREDYFVKGINGQCGMDVKHVSDYDAFVRFCRENGEQDLLFQDRVVQHHEMSRLFPDSVNTLRIVTVMKSGVPTIFSSLLRIGTKQSGVVDNTSQGGIAVGIHEDGRLMEYGFSNPEFGGRIDHHPDTGVVFSDFTIPFYREALSLACRGHEALYRVKSIGWDIAITEHGCVLIEGNDNWELQSFQGFYGGLKNRCKTDLS